MSPSCQELHMQSHFWPSEATKPPRENSTIPISQKMMQGVPETKGWAEPGSEASRTEGSSWSRALLLPCPHSSTCNVKCLSLSPPQASLKAPGSDCFQYQSDSSSLTMKDLMLITSINMFRASSVRERNHQVSRTCSL